MSEHVLELLSAYLDGELPSREQARVEGHLGDCNECSRHLEELAAVDEAARAFPAEAPQGYFDSFASRVRARLSPVPRASARRLPVWTLALAAGLVLAVLTPALIDRSSLAPAPEPVEEPEVPTPTAALAERALGAEDRPSLDEKARAKVPHDDRDVSAKAPARAAGKTEGETKARRAVEADKLTKREAFAAPAAPQPATGGVLPATAAPARARAPEQAHELGFAAPPAPAKAAPALAPDARPPATLEAKESRPENRAAAEEPTSLADASASSTEGGRIDARRKDAPLGSSVQKQVARSPEEARYLGLRARLRPTSAEEARIVREAWRAFAREYPKGSRGDEARFRVVEFGAQAYRRGSDPRDLARLRADAEEYLAREDAARKGRVREILRELEP